MEGKNKAEEHDPYIQQRITEVKALREKAGLLREIRAYIGKIFFAMGYSGEKNDAFKKVDEPVTFTNGTNEITVVATYHDFQIAIKTDLEEENKILSGLRQTGYFRIYLDTVFDDDPVGHKYILRYISDQEKDEELKRRKKVINERYIRWIMKNEMGNDSAEKE